MKNPSVSYIVSAYDRPAALLCCLASLALQTDGDFEVIVADNNPNPARRKENETVVRWFDDRFYHVNSSQWSDISPGYECYWAAEEIVNRGFAKGDYFCFPSDDSYYVNVFQETLLKAAREFDFQLVFCDMLYDRRIGGRYSVLDVQPVSCAIDKTGFLIRRDVWIGFPTKPTELRSSCADGEMIAEVVRRGARHGKVQECLVVHN